MATVTYDDCNFMIDGRRVWLISGSIDYFRVPPELWRDRLLKAKRAGLNCISTCVAWNVHEPVEGKWDFSEAADVAAFVRLAGELGLYVILCPGPYIGGDWDFGGLPGWLVAKSGINVRSSNAAYTHYYDKYLAQLLPRLADLQVTRGGPIILLQNENEYQVETMPDRVNYLRFVSQLFRRAGFDIPIITCNRFSEPLVPETIDCVNGCDDLVQQLKLMRLRQPSLPLLVTQLATGAGDCWGRGHRTADAVTVARRALEALGCGAQINYRMFCGGTNFGFRGGRSPAGPAEYVTTSYDCDAPVAEGGGLTDKYYATRLVSMLANHMGEAFAAAIMDDPGVSVHDSTAVMNISGLAGRWAVVTNNGRRDITTARVALPEGKELTVSLEPLGAAAVPVNVRLTAEHTLDYANCTPLGFFGGRLLVLHGAGGCQAVVSIDGREHTAAIAGGTAPEVIDCDGVRVVLISTDLAMRTWWVDETLVFGPDYVGETLDDMTHPRGAKQYCLLAPGGKLERKKVKPVPLVKRTTPRLSPWKRLSVCTEPVAGDLEWKKMDRPRDLDRCGAHYGYGWYRIIIPRKQAKRHSLFIPDCEDRATIYVNGRHVGIWGRGADARRTPIPVSLRTGDNVVTMLVDNLGRYSSGPGLGEAKGLFGPLYDAKPLLAQRSTFKSAESFPKRMIPRGHAYLTGKLEKLPLWVAETSMPMRAVAPVHLAFDGLPCHAAVICNERMVRLFPLAGETNFGQLTLGAELKRGKNVIRIMLWGQATPRSLSAVTLHSLIEELTGSATWQFRPWTVPEPGGPVVGKNQPAWYVASFKHSPTARPLFLHVIGAKKGQLYLNGHNLGRFWTVGPQQDYYLPACWLEKENELLVFEEQGRIPANSKLAFRSLGPYR